MEGRGQGELGRGMKKIVGGRVQRGRWREKERGRKARRVDKWMDKERDGWSNGWMEVYELE